MFPQTHRYLTTNEEMKARIENAFGPYENLLTREKAQTEMIRARHTTIWTGPRLSYREQFKEEDEEADRGNDGKTTSNSGLALNRINYYGKLRTTRSGGSWL